MNDVKSICPRFHRAAELVGARWNGAILGTLLDGGQRYADVKAAIPGISDTMLAARLRTLEAEQIVQRRVLSGTPVHVEYHLTPKGAALAPVVEALREWSHEWIPLPDAAHAASAR